jgi:aryl-alcohol dehydrogenase-like predicted oxidoreductase
MKECGKPVQVLGVEFEGFIYFGSKAYCLIGASRVEQIEQNVAALGNLSFTAEELASIDGIMGQAG